MPDAVNLALVAATVVSSGTALFTWLDARSDRHRKKLDARIAERQAPLDAQVKALEAEFHAALAAQAALIESSINKALAPVASRLDVMETKMDVFWRQVALDAAKILHQPNPERAMLDHLLDAFTEDTLTPSEELSLRKELVRIRNWEPGQDLGYPVRDGEQTAAAILLRTMDHVITPRGARDGGPGGGRSQPRNPADGNR